MVPINIVQQEQAISVVAAFEPETCPRENT